MPIPPWRRDGRPAAAAETLDELAAWAAAGVALVRDTGSPGGSVLRLGLGPGLPRLQAAGRFLAPAGRYFPALLPEEVPQQRLTELALAELARGGRWVKVIADFPPVADGKPSGPAALTYSGEAVEAMTAAVHAAGRPGRRPRHHRRRSRNWSGRAWIPSSTAPRSTSRSLRLMAQAGTAWTPTLCAVLAVPGQRARSRPAAGRRYRERLHELLPLAHRLGVPILAGTDTAGTVAREVALLAEHGLAPAAAPRGRDHHRVPLPRRALRPARPAGDAGDLPGRPPRGPRGPVLAERHPHRRRPRPLTYLSGR